jgi:hypothetical protein
VIKHCFAERESEKAGRVNHKRLFESGQWLCLEASNGVNAVVELKEYNGREQGGALLTTSKRELQNEKDIRNKVDIAPFRTNIGINKNIDVQSRVEL